MVDTDACKSLRGPNRSKWMRMADRLLGGVMGIFGILCFNEAYRIWKGWDSAGTLLILVGGIFTILFIFFMMFPTYEDESIDWGNKQQIVRIGTIAVCFAIYLTVINWVGYLFATWLLLAGISKYISNIRILRILIWTGAIAVASDIIFKKFMSLPLPVGFLGF